jgi:GTP pyrophosphokinase
MVAERFADACAFALQLHQRQRRKGTPIPYVSHLLAVASLVLEHGGDEDQAIAALLHDSLEDQGQYYPGGTPALRAEIGRRFGAPVLAIVEGCTDADAIPKPPWRARKEAYLAHLPRASAGVLRVSAADKLHNARSILSDYRSLGEWLWTRFTADREQLLWYYRGLLDAFRGTDAPAGLVNELGHTLACLESLIAAADAAAGAA